jgi:hypothetical protein
MFGFEKDRSCLMPVDLFEIECDIPFFQERPKKFSSYKLPNFSELFYNPHFAEVGLYYNDEGIGGRIEAEIPFTGSEYPDFQKGDALELFIATKDMKKASSVSRFCHHFVLFPVEIASFYGKELSHFRQEDSRPISDPLPIEMVSDFDKKTYSMDFFIPKEALYGFEDRTEVMSFTYVLHSPKMKPQEFSVSYDNFQIAQMPSLWASLRLEKKP